MMLRISQFLLMIFLCFAVCREEAGNGLFTKSKSSTTKIAGDNITSLPYYKTIPQFTFLNQDSLWISNQTFAGKIYVANFFFTSCPTICPVMKTQLLRVYGKFLDNPQVMFLSFTIDPAHDTVAVLREYAGQLGVKSNKWHFVTGDEDEIYGLARNSYLAMVSKSAAEPGGFLHSGAFILVDKQGRVRKTYDGTSPADADNLTNDIQTLLVE